MGWTLHEYPDTGSLADALSGELARACCPKL